MSTNGTDSKFTFDIVKGNLETIASEFVNFGSNTSYANESVAEYINNGLSSGINSSTVGAWFSSVWASNTTYAEEFQTNFAEWSQAVTNIMHNSGEMDEEAQGLFKSFEGFPELQYSFYNFNTSVYTRSNAKLMMGAEEAYRGFAYSYYCARTGFGDSQYDSKGLEEYLKSDPEAMYYIFDLAKKDIENKVNSKIEDYELRMFKPQFNGKDDSNITINTDGLNPFTKAIGDYWNKNQCYPTADDLNIFSEVDFSIYDPTPKEELK